MTDTPTTLRFNEKTHRYWLDGKPVPGVTGIIDRGYATKGLPEWVARVTAEFADENWDSLLEDNPKTRYWRVRKAADAIKITKGKRGSRVHKAIERYLQGVDTILEDPIDRAMFYGWLEWWHNSGLEIVEQERRCASRSQWYAGTFDALAKDESGGLWVLDWKTSNKVRASHAIQLTAYAESEFYVDAHGNEQPVPPAWSLGLCVVHIGEDGTHDYPVPERYRDGLREEWERTLEKVRADKFFKNMFDDLDFRFVPMQDITSEDTDKEAS